MFADLSGRAALPRHRERREMPRRVAGHMRGIEVRVVMTGTARHARRARPLSKTHPRTGMLSRAAIWAPQAGHSDRAISSGIPRGTRCATAVAKLPAASPKRKAKAIAVAING